MTLKMIAVVASLSAVALTPSVNEAFARPAGVAAGGGGPVARPSISRPAIARSIANHRRGFVGGFWPGGGFYYGDGPYSAPLTDAGLPMSNDINYNYTEKHDVPWDWAHRFPPMVAPSDRPYVSNCSSEAVTVPGSGGADHTVNIMRCY